MLTFLSVLLLFVDFLASNLLDKRHQISQSGFRKMTCAIKTLAFTNHSFVIENYCIESFLPQKDPDCFLYSEDGFEARIHKVNTFILITT